MKKRIADDSDFSTLSLYDDGLRGHFTPFKASYDAALGIASNADVRLRFRRYFFKFSKFERFLLKTFTL